MQEQECYEDSHLGGYRRIYPCSNSEKYEAYFKQDSSLFQETAASKARDACARYPGGWQARPAGLSGGPSSVEVTHNLPTDGRFLFYGFLGHVWQCSGLTPSSVLRNL